MRSCSKPAAPLHQGAAFGRSETDPELERTRTRQILQQATCRARSTHPAAAALPIRAARSPWMCAARSCREWKEAKPGYFCCSSPRGEHGTGCMTLKVAIIADDLTGALDTGTLFVDAGLSVVVAIDVEAIDDIAHDRLRGVSC